MNLWYETSKIRILGTVFADEMGDASSQAGKVWYISLSSWLWGEKKRQELKWDSEGKGRQSSIASIV